MIVMDNLPFTVLQQDGFRRLISFIVPTYNIPSYEKMRDTIIPSIYARTAEVVKTVLKCWDVVTIMLDLWLSNSMVIRTVTDNASNKTKAFRLQLSNFILEEKEDDFIEMELEAGLEVPNYVLIPEYLECTSSAGGSQNDELEIENLMSTLEIDVAGLIQENCWKINETGFVSATSSHAGCLPHQTKLVIKDGRKKALKKFVSESLDLLCMIVGGVRRSVVDTKVLLDSVGFKIPMMNLTRWNSQFSMVKHFLNGIDIDTALQSKLNACKAHGSLRSLQLKCLKEFVTLLEPFKIATDIFQKDTETIGLVIPFYLDLVN
ncbi:uncharacterized protein LOC123472425 [Daphnia magna]|uniref:uncharacterized protein LOC123472425 n=1 Tax=Daphnia magna TaxID=35525 RepID=UPI001E1BCE20|nr:uncharacterized protein LOC123472425 [Daphnia magna]